MFDLLNKISNNNFANFIHTEFKGLIELLSYVFLTLKISSTELREESA